MLKNIYKPLLILFLIALVLRVYKLSEYPVGFHADEVRAGWNAYSILKTGFDDRGNRFALFYNTFGDYRPTGIFYTTIPSLILFGKNEFAVRLPSALLGALTVVVLYGFVKELLINTPSSKYGRKIGMLAGGLLAFSPWHISVSRATSEVVISMFFALAGIYCFMHFLRTKTRKDFIVAFLLMGTSYFFYHSIRLLAPFLIGTIVVYFWNTIQKKLLVKSSVIFVAGLILLTAVWSIPKEARGRFSQVSIFHDLDVQYELTRMPFEEGSGQVLAARSFHNKPSVYLRRFVEEYAGYFSADFLISSEAKPARYATTGMGLLTYVELLFVVCGLIAIAQKRYPALPLLLLMIAPLVAALTTEDAPNLHRSLYMVLFFSIIGAFGIQWVAGQFTNKLVLYGLGIIFVANFMFFAHMYIVHTQVHIPLYRNIGAKELALELAKIQQSYDKIILTNIPDDPYPWIAFFTDRNPATFNKDALKREHGNWNTGNLYFTGQRCPSRDSFEKPDVSRLLVVDAEGCATESNLKKRTDVKIITTVLRPDRSEVYTFWSMKQ